MSDNKEKLVIFWISLKFIKRVTKIRNMYVKCTSLVERQCIMSIRYIWL